MLYKNWFHKQHTAISLFPSHANSLLIYDTWNDEIYMNKINI